MPANNEITKAVPAENEAKQQSVPEADETDLAPLRSHPVFALADRVARHVGMPRDLIQFTEFLSLAAGKMVVPLNLDVFSDQLLVDMYVANRILDILNEQVARGNTHKEFRTLERAKFCDLAAVLIRGNHHFLYRDASEYTARLVGPDFRLPSLWRISDHALGADETDGQRGPTWHQSTQCRCPCVDCTPRKSRQGSQLRSGRDASSAMIWSGWWGSQASSSWSKQYSHRKHARS